MVVIKVELWPGGAEKLKRSLGRMEISWSIAKTKLLGRRAYVYKLFKWRPENSIWKEGHIVGHEAKNRGPWDLMFRCLFDAVASRNVIQQTKE